VREVDRRSVEPLTGAKLSASRRENRAAVFLTAVYAISLAVFSLGRGADNNFDLINVKWYAGWTTLRGDFELRGLATSRQTYPPFNDAWQSLLAGVGAWWLPVLVWTLIHASSFPIALALSKRIAPNIPSLIQVALSALTVATPLALMQLGTSFGHLAAAPGIGLSLLLMLTANDLRGWALAGAALSIMPLMKASALATVPALLLGASILAPTLRAALGYLVGFFGAYLGVAVGWATYVTLRTDSSIVSTPGVPLSGSPLILATLVSIGIALAVWLRSEEIGVGRSFLKLGAWAEPASLVGLRVVLFVVAIVRGRSLQLQVVDARFPVLTWERFFDRLNHTGALIDGYRPLDLEVEYFDTSIPVASVLLLAVICLFGLNALRPSTRYAATRLLGAGIFLLGPVFYAIWTTGYTRYAVQSVVWVPIGALALVAAMRPIRWMSILSACVLTVALALPLLPGVASAVPIARFAQPDHDRERLQPDEAEMLSSLLPEGSTIYSFGEEISFAGAVLNRSDLTWEFKEPAGDTLAQLEQPLMTVYNPEDAELLEELRLNGLDYRDCVQLRFTASAFGVCRVYVPE